MFTRRRLLCIVKVCVVLPLALRGFYWTAIMDGSRLQQYYAPASVASPTVPATPVTLWQPPVPEKKYVIDGNGTNVEVFSELIPDYAFVSADDLDFLLHTQPHTPRRMHLYITRRTSRGSRVAQVEIRNIEHVHGAIGSNSIALLASQ